MTNKDEALEWLKRVNTGGNVSNPEGTDLFVVRLSRALEQFKETPAPEGMRLRIDFAVQTNCEIAGALPPETVFDLGGKEREHRVVVNDLKGPVFQEWGSVEVKGALMDARFEGGHIGEVKVHAGGSLNSASGEPAVLTNEGFVSGAPEAALKPGRLESGTGQYENIDVSRLTVADLQAIRAAERFVPHMPRSRRTALRYAESMTMGRQDPNSNATSSERVHFWTRLAALVGAQGGAGETATMVKEVATVLHRKALPLRSPQRWLLEISRIFGYGTRLRRPLVVWALATLAGWGLLAYWSGLKDFPQELAWWELPKDLLLSPLNFFRSTPIPTEEWVAGLGAKFRLVLQIVRGVSSTAIAFFAVAVRRYTAPIRRS